ncbi:MAG: signal peptidase I [Actinomycetota bacterium]
MRRTSSSSSTTRGDGPLPPPGAPPPPPPPPPPPQPPELSTTEPPPDEERKHKPFWRELPVLIVVAFAIALLLKSFVLQAFFIPSASMENTLMVGDRVLVEKISYRFSEPDRGDVVVFERDVVDPSAAEEEDESVFEKITDSFRSLFGFPTGGAQDFIKRVIGVGGDTVEGRDGIVFVNGEPIEEPYLPEDVETSSFGPVTVPDGTIFVMGDNRGNSEDSRAIGPIDIDAVVGKAFILIWPPSDFGTL